VAHGTIARDGDRPATMLTPGSRSVTAFLIGSLFAGCASPAAPQETPEDASTERRCVPPPGVSGSPQTIDEVVALIDALPPPVTLPCFLESLDRPLHVEAAVSRFSAQPAYQARSPRLFVFIGDLVLTVVPEGSGASLLEMGEFVDETHSRKGELELPITPPVAASAPYDRVRYEAGTTCGGCHAEESRDETVDFADAFVSRAVRPWDGDLVAIDRLRSEWLACRPEEEPDRCAMLEAIFAHGPVEHRGFPESLPTL